MIELFKPLESQHKQLVAELSLLDELSDAINSQACKIDELEKAAAETMADLKKLSLSS